MGRIWIFFLLKNEPLRTGGISNRPIKVMTLDKGRSEPSCSFEHGYYRVHERLKSDLSATKVSGLFVLFIFPLLLQ